MTIFACRFCNARYYNRRTYLKHVKTHENQPSAQQCSTVPVESMQWDDATGTGGNSSNLGQIRIVSTTSLAMVPQSEDGIQGFNENKINAVLSNSATINNRHVQEFDVPMLTSIKQEVPDDYDYDLMEKTNGEGQDVVQNIDCDVAENRDEPGIEIENLAIDSRTIKKEVVDDNEKTEDGDEMSPTSLKDAVKDISTETSIPSGVCEVKNEDPFSVGSKVKKEVNDVINVGDILEVANDNADRLNVVKKEENAEQNESSDGELSLRIASVSGGVEMPDMYSAQMADNNEAAKNDQSNKGMEKSRIKTCIVCEKIDKCKYDIVRNGYIRHLCDSPCFDEFKKNPAQFLYKDVKQTARVSLQKGLNFSAVHAKQKDAENVKNLPPVDDDFKKCTFCRRKIKSSTKSCLSWQTFEFCREECLEKYILTINKQCFSCSKRNSVSNTCGIRNCLKIGDCIRKFCSSSCLNVYKNHQKICKCCLKDTCISENVGAFVAPTGKTGIWTYLCSPGCLKKYEEVSKLNKGDEGSATCVVCHKFGPIKQEVKVDGKIEKICSNPCLSVFQFAIKLTVFFCSSCSVQLNKPSKIQSIQFEGQTKQFCNSMCFDQFKKENRKIVPCSWCRIKKRNFNMIERLDCNNDYQLFCSLKCLSLYRARLKAVSYRSVACDHCHKNVPAQYHLTVENSSIYNFCSCSCALTFQARIIDKGLVQRSVFNSGNLVTNASIQSTKNLMHASVEKGILPHDTILDTESIFDNGLIAAKNLQTHAPGKRGENHMTPVLAQETENVVAHVPVQSSGGQMKLVTVFGTGNLTTDAPVKIENVETDAQDTNTEIPVTHAPVKTESPLTYAADQETENLRTHALVKTETLMTDASVQNTEIRVTSNKLSYEAAKPSGELELEVQTPNTSQFHQSVKPKSIKNQSLQCKPVTMTQGTLCKPDTQSRSVQTEPQEPPPSEGSKTSDEDYIPTRETRGQGSSLKRSLSESNRSSGSRRSKRARVQPAMEETPTPPAPAPEAQEEVPDADFHIKYTYGISAWNKWVVQKNVQLEKAFRAGSERVKLFKTDMLACTADELNFSLCLFVKEIRKPNEEEYNADNIYYLCLGIQKFLSQNQRNDNIFTDPNYNMFTEFLNAILMQYNPTVNNSGQLVYLIEEEHLWECEQLGAHSPHVLLNTLVYFNTKYFMLRTAEDHLKFAFNNVSKNCKKTMPTKTNSTGRSVYLRYFCPWPTRPNDINKKNKKEEMPIYEQAENLDNPLRCPVKLYEFYVSKCPKSMKNRSDVFYLTPERSCDLGSPVWYSTISLSIDAMNKMLNRLLLVKEIQEALHDQPAQSKH